MILNSKKLQKHSNSLRWTGMKTPTEAEAVIHWIDPFTRVTAGDSRKHDVRHWPDANAETAPPTAIGSTW